MLSRVLTGVALAVCLLGAGQVRANCSEPLRERFDQVDSIVQSLRADKPGVARVFARDGSEYTGGQVYWMHSQMSRVARMCTAGSVPEQERAAATLAEVEELIRSHRRNR